MKFKKLAASLIAASMVFAPVSAMAEETAAQTPAAEAVPVSEAPAPVEMPAAELGLQLNGKDLTFEDAAPVIENNRVFVPFRAVFEGLNAEVSYDDTTKAITAVKGDKTVVFTIGDKVMKITADGKEETVETDAASFIKSNRTYVPVRFAAQALDCTVGWDDANKTAIILDKSALVDETATYEIMNKYIAASKEFSEKTYAITGDMNLDMSINNGEKAMPIKGTCNITGITDTTSLNMDMALALDLAALKEDVDANGGDEDTDAMIEQLSNMKFSFIFDLETGKFYIQSDIFAMMLGAAEGTWYSIDFNELMAGAGASFTDVIMEASKIEDFGVYVNSMLDTIPTDNKYMTQAMIMSYEMLKDMYKDSAFTEKDGNYVSNYTQNIEGSSTSMSMTIPKESTNADFSMVMTSGYNGTEIMKMTMDQKDLVTTFAMTMAMEGLFSMNIDGTFSYSETTNAPITAPAKDAKVISLSDSFLAIN